MFINIDSAPVPPIAPIFAPAAGNSTPQNGRCPTESQYPFIVVDTGSPRPSWTTIADICAQVAVITANQNNTANAGSGIVIKPQDNPTSHYPTIVSAAHVLPAGTATAQIYHPEPTVRVINPSQTIYDKTIDIACIGNCQELPMPNLEQLLADGSTIVFAGAPGTNDRNIKIYPLGTIKGTTISEVSITTLDNGYQNGPKQIIFTVADQSKESFGSLPGASGGPLFAIDPSGHTIPIGIFTSYTHDPERPDRVDSLNFVSLPDSFPPDLSQIKTIADNTQVITTTWETVPLLNTQTANTQPISLTIYKSAAANPGEGIAFQTDVCPQGYYLWETVDQCLIAGPNSRFIVGTTPVSQLLNIDWQTTLSTLQTSQLVLQTLGLNYYHPKGLNGSFFIGEAKNANTSDPTWLYDTDDPFDGQAIGIDPALLTNPETTQIDLAFLVIKHQIKKHFTDLYPQIDEAQLATLAHAIASKTYGYDPLAVSKSDEYMRLILGYEITPDQKETIAYTQWIIANLLQQGYTSEQIANPAQLMPELLTKTTFDINEAYASLVKDTLGRIYGPKVSFMYETMLWANGIHPDQDNCSLLEENTFNMALNAMALRYRQVTMQNPGKQIIKLAGADFTYPVQIDYANAGTETTFTLESAGKIQAYAIDPQTGALRLIKPKTPYQYNSAEIIFIWNSGQSLTASIAVK